MQSKKLCCPMQADGVDAAMIAKYTGLTAEEIAGL
jgi:hypothetical protein